MVRTIGALTIGLVLACLAAQAFGQPRLTEEEIYRLIDEVKTIRAHYDTLQKDFDRLRDDQMKLQRNQAILREELARRGVDVEQLLQPPSTQPQAESALLVFESPEAVTEYLRENFSQRVRPDMTRLQREVAETDFNNWVTSCALVPSRVTWVLKVTDVWRAARPEQVALDYAIDRLSLNKRLATLPQSLDELEMLSLNVARLKTEQKTTRLIYEKRLRELAAAPTSQKPLAERVMNKAYADMVEVNVQFRAAEALYLGQKNMAKPGKATTQADRSEYRIIIHGRGARDEHVELTLFCAERDRNLLMAAPKDSLVKVRGWLSDIALADRVASVGMRMDHCEVLAVNVESPPPPPVLPYSTSRPDASDGPPPTAARP